jgi:hypothetical protein
VDGERVRGGALVGHGEWRSSASASVGKAFGWVVSGSDLAVASQHVVGRVLEWSVFRRMTSRRCADPQLMVLPNSSVR